MKYKWVTILLAAILLLAGCAQTPPPSSQSEAENTPQIEEPVQAAPERLVIGISQDFDSLDPGKIAATGTQEVMFNIFHGLINITSQGEIVPELCSRYEASQDMLSYTFYLREDAKFHNGSPVTAQDVAYTYRRLMGQTQDQTEPLNAELAKTIRAIETPDPTTVVFQLEQPSASFIALCMTGIIPNDSGATIGENPVGTGPYQFESYRPGVGITMTRFEDYYGEKPFFPVVDFKIFTDSTTVQLALQQGEIHIMQFQESVFSYDESRLKLIKQPQNMVQMLAFNHTFEPFTHLEVRQAINHAIDKQSIIDFLSPGSPKIDTNFSPVMSFYYNQELEDFYAYDPEKAKSLLAQAGYSDLAFTVKVPAEYKFHLDTAQIIQQQLAQVGITMKIEPVEWNTWLTEVYTQGKHEATIVGLTGKIDPGSVMIRSVTGYNRNFFHYSNPEYDRLIEEASEEGDQDQRAQLYKEAQKVATQDALMVPLMDPGSNLLMDKHIQGYRSYPIGYIDLRGISWE